MAAWLDENDALWLAREEGTHSRCRDLTKSQLVAFCEQLDIYPATTRVTASLEVMIHEVTAHYDLELEELEELEEDLLEFYWEWARHPRKDICRRLYDHFCALNVIDRNCAVDREVAERLRHSDSSDSEHRPLLRSHQGLGLYYGDPGSS
jgi:hypothetical protein